MRILFIGTGEIGLPTLRMLCNWEAHELVGVVTQPDKPAGRKQELTSSPIKKATEHLLVADPTPECELRLPLLQLARIKNRESIDAIRALQPDVIVVMAYGQILPRDVLEIPKVACLNLHASLLPRWRGAAPIQAAIAGGDSKTGITVMYMDEGLDTGDVLLQRKIDIGSDDTARSLHEKLAQLAPEALAEAISLLDQGKAPRFPQKNELVTYAPKLEREHGRIDWSEPAAVIERKIRAFNPWPGAFMEIDDHKLKIFSATIADRTGRPGEILPDKKEMIIAAADGALSLGEVQLEGKRRMSAAEFLRGHSRLT